MYSVVLNCLKLILNEISDADHSFEAEGPRLVELCRIGIEIITN
jgi:hypothetical protein